MQLNFHLYPSIAILIKAVVSEMAPSARDTVFRKLRDLIASGAYTVQVPTHIAYTVRLLAYDFSSEADEILGGMYQRSRSSAVRRDIILAMAHRNAAYWVSDVRKTFGTVTVWERTALLVASYILGDEGKYWRTSIKGALTPMQVVVKDWASSRADAGQREVPM